MDRGLFWLLLGAGAVYLLSVRFGIGAAPAVQPSPSPLHNFPSVSSQCGPGLIWGPIPGFVPSFGCVTPQVAAMHGAEG